MKILIDTHIFLWMLAEPNKLSSQQRHLLETTENDIYLSAISITELMIKASIGKLDINFNPVSMAEQISIDILPFTGTDALALKDMPYHHRDPFDRMIIAQSQVRNIKLMSNDNKFSLYDCELIR